MAGSSRRRTNHWYGYLLAGDCSSPVLRDDELETGSRKTIYLFNLRRGEIIEYSLEIVANKLRELKPDETGCIGELDAGYRKARRGFRRRAAGKPAWTDDDVVLLRKFSGRSVDADPGEDDSGLWLDTREA